MAAAARERSCMHCSVSDVTSIPRLSSQNFVVLCKTLLLQTCQKPTNTINKKIDLRDLVEQGPELVHSREPQDAM
jgi:hypothetical protein